MSLITKSINLNDLLRFFGLIIFYLFCLSFFLQAGVYYDFFPKPSPKLDVDRVIISNKVKLSKSEKNADILLIGDSSCLMNIDANKLTDISGKKTYNLGTISYLDFESYGDLLSNALINNDNPVSLVCLFIHPEFLRRATPSNTHIEFFKSCNNDVQVFNSNIDNLIYSLLNLNIFKDTFRGRIPNPLKNKFRQYYGFTTSLDSYLSDHNGSAIDPRVFDSTEDHGNILYKITDKKINQLIKFTSIIPPDCKFVLCLTPVPSEITGMSYSSTMQSIIEKIRNNGKVENILQMPFTLPAKDFATKTHLNSKSRTMYTDMAYKEMVKLGIIEE